MGVELLNRSNATTKSKYPKSIKIVHFEGPNFLTHSYANSWLSYANSWLSYAFLRGAFLQSTGVLSGFDFLTHSSWLSYAISGLSAHSCVVLSGT